MKELYSIKTSHNEDVVRKIINIMETRKSELHIRPTTVKYIGESKITTFESYDFEITLISNNGEYSRVSVYARDLSTYEQKRLDNKEAIEARSDFITAISMLK